ncbi:MAG TPA: hypothetical protein VEB22_14820 [Phycisphaerales bacterium]|nr:hypothetical protein [Phycisphaerales bacterium]
MAAIPIWLWLLAGWTAIAGGAWLAAVGRFRRTVPGRRCRRCGYDMQGLVSLTCPECGRAARTDRELLRRPARLGARTAGLALVLAGAAFTLAPSVVRHGWAGAAPDWFLARYAAISSTQPTRTLPPSIWTDPLATMRVSVVIAPAVNPPEPPVTDTWQGRRAAEMRSEIVRRFVSGEIGASAATTYLRRAVPLDEKLVAAQVPFPDEWPSDADPVTVRRSAVAAHLRVDRTGAAPRLRVDIDYTVGKHAYAAATFWPAADVTRPSSSFMRPITGEQADTDLLRNLGLRLCTDGRDAWLILDGESRDEVARPFVVADVRLLLDGRSVAAGRLSFKGRHLGGVGVHFPPLVWERGGKAAVNARPSDVELELTGRPEAAIGFYFDNWSQGCGAWGGSVRFKPPHEPRNNTERR